MSKRQLEEDSAANKRLKLQIPMCKCGVNVVTIEGECFKCAVEKTIANHRKVEDEENAAHLVKIQDIAKSRIKLVEDRLAIKKKERVDERTAALERFTKNLDEQVQTLLAMLTRSAVSPS